MGNHYAFQSTFCGNRLRYPCAGSAAKCATPQLVSTCPRKTRAKSTTLTMTTPDLANSSRRFKRRTALQLIALGASVTCLSPEMVIADQEYSTYKGPISLGFTFSYPSSWNVKKKPIKTHLSEVIVTSDKESSTTAGIVVDSVKIDAIDKFGTPEAVGKKVVDVENKKESVNTASVVGTDAVTKDGLTYYIIDYIVDSSRGVKRYLAKATIAGGQLYVFTAQAKTDGFEGDTQNIFQKMLESFNVAKQYL